MSATPVDEGERPDAVDSHFRFTGLQVVAIYEREVCGSYVFAGQLMHQLESAYIPTDFLYSGHRRLSAIP